MKPADVQVEPEIVAEVRGSIAEDLPDYIREKVAEALTRTRHPVPRVHVRVVKHGDPARGEGVTPHANVDLDGRPLLVHSSAATPRGSVDLLVERLRPRLERLPLDRRPRQGLFVETTTGQDAVVYRGGLPFLFYVDADHERANVLYLRDDGVHGLIDPAVRS